MSEQIIGVIGGSGLYEIDGLEVVEERTLETPFGSPSDTYLIGNLSGRRVIFLPRHGRGHRLLPSELNYCANIYGFKQLGARWLISLSAVGSMREHIAPGDVVIADQFIDRTRSRRSTFFGEGVVGHIQFGDPVCSDLAAVLYDAAQAAGARTHRTGTYICIEGPQFSTRAESQLYRSWGVDVIGMTNMPEAKLAREAGICYATVALVTDYDCWHDEEDDVSVQSVLETLRRNVATARRIIAGAIAALPDRRCQHADAGQRAVFTQPDAMNEETRRRLAVILEA